MVIEKEYWLWNKKIKSNRTKIVSMFIRTDRDKEHFDIFDAINKIKLLKRSIDDFSRILSRLKFKLDKMAKTKPMKHIVKKLYYLIMSNAASIYLSKSIINS